MSDNYKLYAQKMVELKSARAAASLPLRAQLEDLLAAVRWCEKVWALEDRVERSLEHPD